MHPHNIFAEALLLFIVGLILLVRDRGSAVSSTNYDALLSGVLITLSFVRLSEHFGSIRDPHVMARNIVWLMNVIPVLIFGWLLYHNTGRADLILFLILSIAILIGVTIYLISGAGGYDLISPNPTVGPSNGIYLWIRTDNGALFLPFLFYMMLTIALMYLTIFSFTDKDYWILGGTTALGFLIAAACVPQIVETPIATLGSLSTLVMLGVGMIAIFMVPG